VLHILVNLANFKQLCNVNVSSFMCNVTKLLIYYENLLFVFARCCCIGLISCEIAISNYS